MTPALDGVRVVCIAVYVPAVVATARLRDLGATVTFVQPPGGDPLETMAPAWYAELHASATTLALDLKTGDGRARLESLLGDADVLFTAFRLPSLDRMGLGWEALHARHPRLSHVAVVGFGGERSDEPGHDLTFQAEAGIVAQGELPRTLVADLAGAERAATAALALLLGRERGRGAGRDVVALADAAHAFAAPLHHGLTAPDGVLGGGLPGYGIYEARDGWIAVGALEPHFLEQLCDALGIDPAAVSRATLQAAFARETAAHWEGWSLERRLPIASCDIKIS